MLPSQVYAHSLVQKSFDRRKVTATVLVVLGVESLSLTFWFVWFLWFFLVYLVCRVNMVIGLLGYWVIGSIEFAGSLSRE